MASIVAEALRGTGPRPRHLRVVPAAAPVPAASPGGRYVRWVKPLVDRIAAALLLVLTAPLLLVSLLLVRLALGPGTVLRQPRVGRGGRVFTLYKVRTMMPDRRERPLGFVGDDRRRCHKRDDDPRHTPLGRVLRKYSLDELPQLWNVVRGEMSLVGPRPELLSVVQQYGLWDHPRHLVRPGITGPWQVSELRLAPLHENLHLDTSYVEQQSLRADLEVVGATVSALVRPRGH